MAVFVQWSKLEAAGEGVFVLVAESWHAQNPSRLTTEAHAQQDSDDLA